MNRIMNSDMQAENSNFHFIVPVWGEEYTKLFTDIVLPLLLTPGNIGFFKEDASALFVITTTFRDCMAIKESKSFKNLEKMMAVRFHLMDLDMDFPSTHHTMTRFYQEAMESEDVKKGLTSYVFLTPDSFWSEGAFKRLFELKHAGYDVVMVTGLRTSKEDMKPILKKRIRDTQQKGVFNNRELVGLALENLHPMAQAHDVMNPSGFLNDWPSNIYWKVDNDLMITHCFHMHPLLVKSKRSHFDISTTIDGDLLEKLNYPLSKYHIVQDSDEIVGIEISGVGSSWGRELQRPSRKRIRFFAVNFCSRLHWFFFSHRIVYHKGGKGEIPPELDKMILSFVKNVDEVRWISRIAYPLRIYHRYIGAKSLALRTALLPLRGLRALLSRKKA